MSKRRFKVYPTKLLARNVRFYAMEPPCRDKAGTKEMAARLHASAALKGSGRNLADATPNPLKSKEI
ncbi:hypothetical protein Pam5_63 [Pseudanabaena phage Pam5]|nr:hypothetical protein Pam5_63 [Pseudanabaena phage Pam5]